MHISTKEMKTLGVSLSYLKLNTPNLMCTCYIHTCTPKPKKSCKSRYKMTSCESTSRVEKAGRVMA